MSQGNQATLLDSAREAAKRGEWQQAYDLFLERGEPASASRVSEPSLTFSTGLDAGELLDAQAKEAYRRRLAEIEEDIDEARAMGDAERAEQAEVERDFLVRELARAVGLGGRDRRARSASERARASVTRAVRHALARIHAHHPALRKHLDRTIRIGTYRVYLPDPQLPQVWLVRDS
jgi:uncharacterized membrane protein